MGLCEEFLSAILVTLTKWRSRRGHQGGLSEGCEILELKHRLRSQLILSLLEKG